MPDLHHATSTDGTRIAYEAVGSGDPILLIGGAFNDRTTMTALAGLLAPLHTVVVYDRRGRGDSQTGPTLLDDDQFAAAEIADVASVLQDAARLTGHTTGWHVFGHSSGAVLALRAATESGAHDIVTRVTAYEPTWIVPGTRALPPADYRAQVHDALRHDDRDAAAAAFLQHSALVPPAAIQQMGGTPPWFGMTALAHTLPNDLALHGPDWTPPRPGTAPPDKRVAILVGSNSPQWFHATAQAAAGAYAATTTMLPGQDHTILWQPQDLVPHLT
jgi:pimeloyl-ACP methyl ester carboxylesterase